MMVSCGIDQMEPWIYLLTPGYRFWLMNLNIVSSGDSFLDGSTSFGICPESLEVGWKDDDMLTGIFGGSRKRLRFRRQ